jgi:hypothetical protein
MDLRKGFYRPMVQWQPPSGFRWYLAWVESKYLKWTPLG